jgi:zinc-dependent metalloproteinase lipoprotein
MYFLSKTDCLGKRLKVFMISIAFFYFNGGCIKDDLELLTENTKITLPVIFHILHNGEKIGVGDNISSQIVYEQLDTLNKQFRGEDVNGINTFIQFKLAILDPQGNSLNERGINRIYVKQDSFDGEKVRQQLDWNRKLIWDPDQYVNIFIVDFNSSQCFASPPFTTSYHKLDGLDVFNIVKWENYLYDQAIYMSKSTFIGLHSFNAGDGSRILTHEMGHFLGLDHIYDDDNCNGKGDYCDDTHDYNRETYDRSTMGYQRKGCDGVVFTSENFMDLYPCYNHQFSNDQIKRMRHVCSFSPFRCNLNASLKGAPIGSQDVVNYGKPQIKMDLFEP